MSQASTSAPPEETILRQRVKSELRSRMQSIRRALPEDARQKRSLALCERLKMLSIIRCADAIAVFCPMRFEPNIMPFIEHLWSAGKMVSAPRIQTDTDTLELRHFSSKDDALEKHSLGGEQPSATAPLVSHVDVVIVPALAIDERGFRIGYGRGYYDKLLTTLDDAITVGVIFDFQRVVELPNESHDVAVQWIVTDERELGAVHP